MSTSSTQPTPPLWIELEGVVNMRDLGGRPTAGGGRIRPGVLLRSDNLQDLPAASVRRLVDEVGISDVVDLRTDLERRVVGEGPLKREELRFHELTLYPEGAKETGIPDDRDEEPDRLPWEGDFEAAAHERQEHDEHLANHYLGYLTQRPDHVMAALKAIAHAPGAVLVHCAAGKDRTGTICALALSEVGVPREEVVADYDTSNQRTEQIMQRLASTEPYATDLVGQSVADQTTPASTMRMLLASLDQTSGGPSGWMRAHGWSEDDARALRAKLVDAPQPD
ncbi:tyrosine-protein phosphatase PtbB [Luteococcus sediminum]